MADTRALRDLDVWNTPTGVIRRLLNEAADEIERLHEATKGAWTEAQVEAATAPIEQCLLDALVIIASYEDAPCSKGHRSVVKKLSLIAKGALAKHTREPSLPSPAALADPPA